MQAYRVFLKQKGPFDPKAIDTNLSLDTVPIPSAGPGQVLVRIHAVSLNFRDLLVASSDPRYVPTSEGIIPCADGAGVVSESTHPDWKAGDRVIILLTNSWKDGNNPEHFDLTKGLGSASNQGTLAQYVAVDAESLIRAPDNLSMEEASTLSVAYGTAWNALYGGQVPLEKGHYVVTEGTGGVSLAALQLATAVGAKVIGTTSSNEKIGLLTELGAVDTINYRETPEWSQRVQQVTGRGADHVLDVGGSATIVESLRAARRGGYVSVIGILSDSEKHDLIPQILLGAKTVRGILYTSVAQLKKMVAFVEENAIKPPLAKTFAWTEAKDAYKLMASGKFTGKIVVKVG